MGTSSSFGGPKKHTALLPSWADEPMGENPTDSSVDDSNDNDLEDLAQMGNWTTAKGNLVRYANDRGSTRSAGRGYVGAMGGAKKATRAASKGISGISGLGGFLSEISRNGFAATIEKYGLKEFEGDSVHEMMPKIADFLVPDSNTNDEVIVKKAITDALMILYDMVEEREGFDLEKLNDETIIEVIKIATQEYIYTKWLYEIGNSIHKKGYSTERICEIENDIRDFVETSVANAFKNTDVQKGLNSKEFNSTIAVIFENAYNLIS
jgi:hypothetical protein